MRDYSTLHLDTNLSKEATCSIFHSHSRVFNNEHNSYSNMSVERPTACC